MSQKPEERWGWITAGFPGAHQFICLSAHLPHDCFLLPSSTILLLPSALLFLLSKQKTNDGLQDAVIEFIECIWGAGSASEAVGLQARGPESDSQNPRGKVRHGGVHCNASPGGDKVETPGLLAQMSSSRSVRDLSQSNSIPEG